MELDTLILICAAIAIFVAVIKRIRQNRAISTVTQLNRGTKAERNVVYELLKYGIPKENIFHDLYVEYRTGHYSQIDVVVITEYGLLVIEDKDYSGWLFGSGEQQYWTQVLNYGKDKYRFYNPVLQNKGHIWQLKNFLNSAGVNVPMYSVLVFHEKATLKNIHDIPIDCHLIYSCNMSKFLKFMEDTHQKTYIDLPRVRELLSTAVLKGANPYVVEKHISNCYQEKNF